VIFNYLGQVDPDRSTLRRFKVVAAPSGPTAAPQQRSALLEINAAVRGGQFTAIWTYSANRHEAATVTAVAHSFLAELRANRGALLSPEAGGYTPSDFGDVPLSQSELDLLIADSGH